MKTFCSGTGLASASLGSLVSPLCSLARKTLVAERRKTHIHKEKKKETKNEDNAAEVFWCASSLGIFVCLKSARWCFFCFCPRTVWRKRKEEVSCFVPFFGLGGGGGEFRMAGTNQIGTFGLPTKMAQAKCLKSNLGSESNWSPSRRRVAETPFRRIKGAGIKKGRGKCCMRGRVASSLNRSLVAVDPSAKSESLFVGSVENPT